MSNYTGDNYRGCNSPGGNFAGTDCLGAMMQGQFPPWGAVDQGNILRAIKS